MNCQRVTKNLAAFLDNELSVKKARRVKEHLALCAACRLRETELRQSWSLLNLFSGINLPTDFAYRIEERIRSRRKLLEPLPRPAPISKYSKYSLAAVILLVVGLYLFITPTANEPPVLTELQTGVACNLELLQNLEILENPELLKELDILLDCEEEDFESS